MRPFRPPSLAPARAPSPRILRGFKRGVDDPALAIFDLALAHIRERVPPLAHRPQCELEILFGDLANEIREITDQL
jgi:hypothetical protein